MSENFETIRYRRVANVRRNASVLTPSSPVGYRRQCADAKPNDLQALARLESPGPGEPRPPAALGRVQK